MTEVVFLIELIPCEIVVIVDAAACLMKPVPAGEALDHRKRLGAVAVAPPLWVGGWMGGWIDRGEGGLNEMLDSLYGWIGGWGALYLSMKLCP